MPLRLLRAAPDEAVSLRHALIMGSMISCMPILPPRVTPESAVIDEIVGSAAGGLLRGLLHLLFEFFFEVLIRGAGYVICRPFNRGIRVESGWCAVVGLLFWLAVIAASFFLYAQFKGSPASST